MRSWQDFDRCPTFVDVIPANSGGPWSPGTLRARSRASTQRGRDLSRPIRAREADDGGKDEDCGRLAAWAGLDLGDDIAGEVLRCPAQGAERGDGREHSLLLAARHEQGLEGYRTAVGAVVLQRLRRLAVPAVEDDRHRSQPSRCWLFRRAHDCRGGEDGLFGVGLCYLFEFARYFVRNASLATAAPP